jgi:hypothetical protein
MPKAALFALVAVAASFSACGSDDGGGRQLPVAVFTAFPAELLPVVERADVETTATVAGRTIRVGTLGGTPVVIAMTGVGLQNAAAISSAVLDRFAVAGVVFSGVAGSPYRIGDVVVPEAWTLPGGSTFGVDGGWLEIAVELAAAASIEFDTCTERPSAPSEPPVCLSHQPAIIPGGVGRSSDPFGGSAPACQPNGGDVFGCDIAPPAAGSSVKLSLSGAGAGDEEPTVVDMETAAVAREAEARGLPFIAFRAVSDGEGDPLNLPGFPAQFFTYYRLAARNAAAATVAFLERL